MGMDDNGVWNILTAYAITFGWALAGALGMGIGLAVLLWIFTRLTPEVNEWKLIKEGNLAMGIVVAAVIIAAGLVVAAAIRP